MSSDVPDDWFRRPPGAGNGPNNAGAGDQTQEVPVSQYPRPSRPAGSSRPGSAWPEQPPASRGGASGGRGGAGYTGAPPAAPRRGQPGRPGAQPGGGGAGLYRPSGGGGRRWLRPRRIFGGLAVIIALLLVASVAMYFNLNGRLHREAVLTSYAGRPAQGSGTNWLIAGSDSRQGLTRRELRRLSAGQSIGGHRSDTILILHIPASGTPLLISVPRDSWVSIPGYGGNKINAAYDFGGPQLLAKTIQNETGLRIDHYMEIGFGGFVGVVNAVGGVHMCIKYDLRDAASGLHIRKGCQTLDGAKALAYVRDRHDFAEQDLQREEDQRLLLKALLSKLTSTGVLLNPLRLIPAADGATGTLTVDKGTSLLQLVSAAFALRHPDTTTMPIATASYVVDGQDAVLWDSRQVRRLVNDLNAGRKVPKSLISGSHQAG
jgi:LCP family protein required for cell wall assembly